MRWLRLLICLLVLSTFFVSAPRAQACSCLPPPPPLEAMAQSDAVFAGRVTDILIANQGPEISSADPVRVTFEVQRAWKDTSISPVQVTTPRDSASCGFNFEVGREYIVYATKQDDGLATGLCSRTSLLSDAAQDAAALGEGQVTTLPDAGAALPFENVALLGVAALVMLFAGAGVLIFARRGSP